MSDYPKVIPSVAFGPLGRPRDEELRFWRLIETREDEKGHTDVRLACGHSIVFMVGIPETQEYAYCPTCVHEWLAAEKRLKDGTSQ